MGDENNTGGTQGLRADGHCNLKQLHPSKTVEINSQQRLLPLSCQHRAMNLPCLRLYKFVALLFLWKEKKIPLYLSHNTNSPGTEYDKGIECSCFLFGKITKLF